MMTCDLENPFGPFGFVFRLQSQNWAQYLQETGNKLSFAGIEAVSWFYALII